MLACTGTWHETCLDSWNPDYTFHLPLAATGWGVDPTHIRYHLKHHGKLGWACLLSHPPGRPPLPPLPLAGHGLMNVTKRPAIGKIPKIWESSLSGNYFCIPPTGKETHLVNCPPGWDGDFSPKTQVFRKIEGFPTHVSSMLGLCKEKPISPKQPYKVLQLPKSQLRHLGVQKTATAGDLGTLIMLMVQRWNHPILVDPHSMLKCKPSYLYILH